jgi:uncharacterized membrane protein YkvA (DUF1232 family)
MDIAKNEYDFYKVKNWVDLERLHWWKLVLQKETIPFIEKHIDMLCKYNLLEKLSLNPFAVELLENHPEKIIWMEFVKNPNAMHVIEKHLDICFASLNSYGKIQLLSHPNFIHIIPKHIDKIVDKLLCRSCIPIIARKRNIVFIDLLEKYMLKYPDKVPDFLSGSYFWDDLASNPCAVQIIEKYLNKLVNSSWQSLAINPQAISILEENLHKLNEIGWYNLCENPNAIPILKKNMDKINWFKLCNNKNAHQIIEECPEKICSYSFIDYDNFSIHSPIFEYDYLTIEKRCNIYKEELMQIALHPSRIEGYLRLGIKVEELDNFI